MATVALVLIPHHGSEGYGEPIAVFHDRQQAEASKAIIDSAGYCQCRLLEVPIWPHLPRKVG